MCGEGGVAGDGVETSQLSLQERTGNIGLEYHGSGIDGIDDTCFSP